MHVGGNFFQHTLLRRRRMEWEYLLDRVAHAGVKLKGDSSLRLLLAPPELQTELDEEQLVEDHSDMRRGARRLQVGETFSGIGPVNFPQRLAQRNQAQMATHRGRE